jgi:citrate lyase subunit beta/citryl-CoA lyase
MMEKAGTRGADVLVLDLEDGVHPDYKEEARERVRDSYSLIDFGPSRVFVRANGLETPWGEDDLRMLGGLRPEGVLIPKAESVEAVEKASGLVSPAPLYLMIETALGVLEAPNLARRSAVAGLLFGAADYRKSLGAGRSPEEVELLVARTSIVQAARAAGIAAFDTPWFEYKDLAGLEASARRARLLGFDGKTAIHPSQVKTINRLFSPSPQEIERARGIVEVMEKALAEGRNVATLGDEMVEALHLDEARRILARATSRER